MYLIKKILVFVLFMISSVNLQHLSPVARTTNESQVQRDVRVFRISVLLVDFDWYLYLHDWQEFSVKARGQMNSPEYKMKEVNYRNIHPCLIPYNAKVDVDCNWELLGINLKEGTYLLLANSWLFVIFLPWECLGSQGQGQRGWFGTCWASPGSCSPAQPNMISTSDTICTG